MIPQQEDLQVLLNEQEKEQLIDQIANYLEQENNWHELKHAWLICGESETLRRLLKESLREENKK